MNTVTIFDKVSGRVSGVVPTGRQPSGMALSEERRRAYLAISGDDRVDVLDLFENAVVDRLHLKAGDGPVEAALTPDAPEPVKRFARTRPGPLGVTAVLTETSAAGLTLADTGEGSPSRSYAQ